MAGGGGEDEGGAQERQGKGETRNSGERRSPDSSDAVERTELGGTQKVVIRKGRRHRTTTQNDGGKGSRR